MEEQQPLEMVNGEQVILTSDWLTQTILISDWLSRWLGVGRKYLEKYSNRTDNKVFLRIKKTKKA